jgi:hypothetical protein
MLSENSFLVNPYLIEAKNVKILYNYKIQDPVDRRLMGDGFNIQELWSLS